jgi:hypothetical protein
MDVNDLTNEYFCLAATMGRSLLLMDTIHEEFILLFFFFVMLSCWRFALGIAMILHRYTPPRRVRVLWCLVYVLVY